MTSTELLAEVAALNQAAQRLGAQIDVRLGVVSRAKFEEVVWAGGHASTDLYLGIQRVELRVGFVEVTAQLAPPVTP